MSNTLRNWLKFNTVGMIGILVQASVLVLLIRVAGFHYLFATFIAVETAVVHNFIWHERWTWMERTRGVRSGLPGRLLRFHLANGFISVGGNLLLMRLFVSCWHLGYLAANALAVAMCSIVNFWASARLVWVQQ